MIINNLQKFRQAQDVHPRLVPVQIEMQNHPPMVLTSPREAPSGSFPVGNNPARQAHLALEEAAVKPRKPERARISGMSADAKWIVGAAGTLAGLIVTASLALATLIIQQSNQLQNRISGIDDRISGIDDRLRSVEVTQGRILERLGEREPAPETVSQALAKHNLDNL